MKYAQFISDLIARLRDEQLRIEEHVGDPFAAGWNAGIKNGVRLLERAKLEIADGRFDFSDE